MAVGIFSTNVHLAGTDNYAASGAVMTYKSGAQFVLAAGSTVSVQSAHASSILDTLGTPAKGTLAVRTASAWAFQAVGSDGQVLVADSTQTNGIKWAAAGSSGFVTTSVTLTANRVLLGNGTADIKVAAGLATDGTSQLQLGVAGASVGSVLFANATSGGITLQPATGALGTITLTMPAVSGTILQSGTAVTAAQGGTGIASYAIGDILYASAATTLSKLPDVAVGSVLISGGVTTAPLWSQTPVVSSATFNMAAANTRYLTIQTAAVKRWDIGANAAAESGANAGSDFAIIAYDDSGASLGTRLSIARSSGAAVFAGSINVGANSITGGAGSFTTLTASGNIVFNGAVNGGVIATDGIISGQFGPSGFGVHSLAFGTTTNHPIYMFVNNAVAGLLASTGLTITGTFTTSDGFGCNSKTAQTAFASGGAAPAGGTGTAAGGWDTAAHRDSAITLLNNIRSALVNNGIMS